MICFVKPLALRFLPPPSSLPAAPLSGFAPCSSFTSIVALAFTAGRGAALLVDSPACVSGAHFGHVSQAHWVELITPSDVREKSATKHAPAANTCLLSCLFIENMSIGGVKRVASLSSTIIFRLFCAVRGKGQHIHLQVRCMPQRHMLSRLTEGFCS